MACSSKAALLCTMPIQLPATCTTARFASSRTNCPCCDSSIRVEGNSRLPRICCHSSARLVLLLLLPVKSGNAGEAVTAGVLSCGAAPALTGGTAGCWAGGCCAGSCWAGRSCGGAFVCVGTGTGAAAVVGAAGVSASKPSSNTSSHSRGCTLWRSCCSLPRNCACHCNKRARPRALASGGSWSRNWGDTPVSSGRSGAAAISTRSRRIPAKPCSTAPGSRPRSSRLRAASSRTTGSALLIACTSCSSSCSGTAPSKSHTAVASMGGGSRLS